MRKLFLSLILLASCATPPAPETSVRRTVNLPSDPNIETVVIAGTNDIHGALAPVTYKTKDSDAIEYGRGGLAWMASYLRQLRREYGDRLLILDGGDQFQGSIESNARQGQPMVEFFNSIGLTAAAVGNHEFDFGQEALRIRMQEARYPYIASNIEPMLPHTVPHLLVQAGRVKVGIVGLSTQHTPVTTIPANVADLRFTDLREATLREATRLRDKGAQLIVITAHVGLHCELPTLVRNQLRTADDAQGDCDRNHEMVELLRTLPPGTVDAVVSGHSHSIVHHWVHGVPVIQSGTRAQNLHLIYLDYDLKNRRLLTEQARIEGPIPICPKVFQNQGDCDGSRPAPKTGRGDLVAPKFRGVPIAQDEEVARTLKPHLEAAREIRARVVGKAARPVSHPRHTESEMGNLVTDSLREITGADFAMMNSGGIRSGFEAGPIRFGDVFQALPFENAVSVLTVSGRELKAILRVAQSYSRGFFPVSGLRLKLIAPQHEASGKDLDGDGRVEPWEIDRLIETRDAGGRPVEDKKFYRLATVDFLVLGGDDFGWVMNRIPRDRVQLTAGPVLRDALVKYLERHSPINEEDNPLIRPDQPRLILSGPAPTEASRSMRGTRRARGKRRR